MDAIAVATMVVPILVAVISVVVNVVITRRNIIAGNRNLFGSLLVQKRFEHYPELYRVLSSFIKDLENFPNRKNTAPISVDSFEKVRDDFIEWDCKYSYLMSKKCVDQWAEYFRRLEKYSADDLKSPETCAYIVQETQGVESALKSDLGVYTLEALGLNKFHRKYPPVDETLGVKIYRTLTAWFPTARELKKDFFPEWHPLKRLGGTQSNRLLPRSTGEKEAILDNSERRSQRRAEL